jgi:hypothetical protein
MIIHENNNNNNNRLYIYMYLNVFDIQNPKLGYDSSSYSRKAYMVYKPHS